MNVPKTFITTILLVTLAWTAQSQRSKDLTPKEITQHEIKELHSGVLLVRLTTKSRTIEALRNAGRTEQAEKVETKQAAVNKEIMWSFKSHFDFCPFYFVFSDQTELIREGKFNEVQLLNDNLEPDSNLTFTSDFVFTAEFGNVGPDTAKTFGGYTYVKGENGLERRATYHSGPSMDIEALIIKNHDFIQLAKPFPFYAKTALPSPGRSKYVLAVEKLNKSLHRYYAKSAK